MKRVELGAVVEYEGELYRVYGHSDGSEWHMRSLERQPCASCNRPFDMHLIERSRLFQDGVKPVATVEETGPDDRAGRR